MQSVQFTVKISLAKSLAKLICSKAVQITVHEGKEGCGAEQQWEANSYGRGMEVIWFNYGNNTVTRHDRGGRVEAQWNTTESFEANSGRTESIVLQQ